MFGLNRFLLLSVLFLTGLTSLVYQVLWIREYSLFFGVHVYSVSTVLAAFMGGLALGSYAFGRLSDRLSGKEGVLFFLIQVFLGLFALFFSRFLGLTADLYVWLGREYDLSLATLNLIRPVLGFALLIIPTSLMGGIIPVASRMFVNRPEQTGARVSLIYLVNNFGAVAGAFLSGFVLVAWLGTTKTFYLAAAINLFLGMAGLLYAYFQRKRVASEEAFKARTDQEEPMGLKAHPTKNDDQKSKRRQTGGAGINSPDYPDRLIRLALWVFGLEAFTTLAYEVIWTRMMVEFSFEKTIYFTTMVIMSFILGLALGGLVFKLIESRIRNLFLFLGTIQVMAGLSSLLLFVLFNHLAPGMIRERLLLQSWWQIAVREYGLIMVMLAIPTIFTGMSFPLISKMLTTRLAHVGSKVGLAGMLDTLGSIGGSLVAGFLMIPLLGIYVSFVVVVGINVLLGLLVFNQQYAMPAIRKNVINILLPGVILTFVLIFPPGAYDSLRAMYYPGERLLFYKEGVSATVSVHEQQTGHLALAINGSKTAFTNNDDMRVHKMLAYLPYVFNPEARSACVIGFGMGVTASTLASLDFEEVRTADITPELLETAIFFSAYNDQITGHPRFTFIPEDGRSYLLRTGRKYDVITSNAVHARLSASLYTREFYQLCTNRINQGGVVCQWVPTNWLTREEFRSLIRAFTDVFDHAQLWFVTRGHLVLVGSDRPMVLDYGFLETLYRDVDVIRDLSAVDLYTPRRFAANLLLAGTHLHDYVAGAMVNTDDLPIAEFSRETSLIPNTQVLQELAGNPVVVDPHIVFSASTSVEETRIILESIAYENQMIRDYLSRFAEAYGQ